MINRWLELSIEYANERSYLDDLFQIYPTIPEGIRDIDKSAWENVEAAFEAQNNTLLVETLLNFDLFPIKDSYIAYLKRDKSAIQKNPKTINRISGRLYEMGLDQIYKKCSEPKETNRQIGPMFKRWLNKKSLGIQPVSLDKFLSNEEDAILDGSDQVMMIFANKYLNYTHSKGLDFVARFNKKYIIGEAKFLTDFGGHQNAQFNDAMQIIEAKDVKAIKIAILDGVLYIKGKSKMHKSITNFYKKHNIMSALVLRDFLYQV